MAEGSKKPSNSALTPADVARVLTRVGGWAITEEHVRSDMASGAPTNEDGTINMTHYAAWLMTQSPPPLGS